MAVFSGLLLLVVVTAVTVLLVRFLREYLHFRSLELAIPGPPTLLGNALDFVQVNPENVLRTVLRMKGNRRELTRMTMFNHMLVLVSDPADIEEVTRRKEFNDKSTFVYSLLHVAAKKGLIMLGGDEWKAHRKWLAPGFNKSVLDRFVEVFSEEARGFAERVEADKEYDVTENLRRTSVKNFLRTSLDSDSSMFEDALLDGTNFLELLLRFINIRSFNPLYWSDTLFLLSSTGKKVLKMNKLIDDAVFGMINHRRLVSNRDESDFSQQRKTLMEILCDRSAGGALMKEEDVVDEVKTFYAANVETTVSAMAWLLKVLSMLPDVQQRVYNELIDVLGQKDRDVTHNDIPQLKYLHRVIKECLRLFPPIPLTGRQCYAESKVCGRTIPAGATILLNILSAHRDPKYWDQPDRFDPDRFLPENCKNRHPCAYVPFSIGSRNCIGATYAMNNMATFLATTLRTFELLPVDDHKDLHSLYENMTFDVTSRLVGGVRVKFQRRAARASTNSG